MPAITTKDGVEVLLQGLGQRRPVSSLGASVVVERSNTTSRLWLRERSDRT